MIFEAIKAGVAKVLGKADVEVGDFDLTGKKVVITFDKATVSRSEGTAGDGFDDYLQTIGLSTKATIAAAISFGGFQGENIEKFLIEAMELARLEKVNGESAIDGMRDIKAAMANVQKVIQTLPATRRTKTMVSVDAATVEVFNADGKPVSPSPVAIEAA
jgi:hypothetical protein